MVNTIKYNLSEMRNSANIIKQNTNHIESIIKSIDRILNDICCEWEGAAYSSFMDNFRRIRPSMNSFVKILEDLHKNLTMAADTMEEKDKALGTKSNSSSSSLWNKIEATVVSSVQAAEGLGNEVGKEIANEFSPGGTGYKALKIGKAVAGISIGAVVIVGSGILEVGSVGSLTAPMVFTCSFGVNSIINGSRDLWYCATGEFEKAGTKDLFRDVISTSTAMVGKLAGFEKVGKLVGETAYYVADTWLSLGGIKKAFEVVKAVDFVKTTCFKHLIIDNWGNAVEVPIKMLVEANPGIAAKVMSSGKLINNAQKLWNRVHKVYNEAVQ